MPESWIQTAATQRKEHKVAHFFKVHPETPQKRLITQAVGCLEQDGVVVYPTDTTYGLGCAINSRKGVAQIIRIRQLPANHRFSLLCPDLADIARYARVDNSTYRLLKRFLPGPYTFVLEATREVPKTILPKRKTIGLRIPDNPICLELLRQFGQPLLNTSLKLPDEEEILSDPEAFRHVVGQQVDLIIDGGILSSEPSTVVDLTGDTPEIIRVGAGDPGAFA